MSWDIFSKSKIQYFLQKLKNQLASVALSGSYVDLSNKPNTVYYGTCTGQASLQNKVVTVSSGQNFRLTTGTTIFVKFDANNTYSATASTPISLNVNSTGNKQIYAANTSAPTGTNTTYFGRANYINQYVYDGTYWVWCGSSMDNNTINSAGASNKTATKMFIVAATSQTNGVTSYSNVNCYIGTDNCLYSNGSKVLTTDDPDNVALLSTSDL